MWFGRDGGTNCSCQSLDFNDAGLEFVLRIFSLVIFIRYVLYVMRQQYANDNGILFKYNTYTLPFNCSIY